MPIYEIELDDGRVVTVEGKREPTASELFDALQGYEPTPEEPKTSSLPLSDLFPIPAGGNLPEIWSTLKEAAKPPPATAYDERGLADLKAVSPFDIAASPGGSFTSPFGPPTVPPAAIRDFDRPGFDIAPAGVVPEERVELPADWKPEAMPPLLQLPKFSQAPDEVTLFESQALKVTPALIPIRKWLGDEGAVQLMRGLADAPADVIEFVGTPLGIATTAASAYPPARIPIMLGFFADLAHGAKQQMEDMIENWPELSSADRGRAIAGLVKTGAFMGLLGRGAKAQAAKIGKPLGEAFKPEIGKKAEFRPYLKGEKPEGYVAPFAGKVAEKTPPSTPVPVVAPAPRLPAAPIGDARRLELVRRIGSFEDIPADMVLPGEEVLLENTHRLVNGVYRYRKPGELSDATKERIIQEGNLGEYPGVPRRENVPADQGEVRQEPGRQAGGGGGVVGGAQGEVLLEPKPSALVPSEPIVSREYTGPTPVVADVGGGATRDMPRPAEPISPGRGGGPRQADEPVTSAPPPAPVGASKPRDWELFNENLIDDLDSFSPARTTGMRNYELDDVANRFVDYAKSDTSGKPIGDLVRDFAKVDEASASQIRKLKQSVKNVLAVEQQSSSVSQPSGEPSTGLAIGKPATAPETATPAGADIPPLPKPTLVGQRVKLKNSPQTFVVVRELDRTPVEIANGEHPVELRNERTGETGAHDYTTLVQVAGVKAVKAPKASRAELDTELQKAGMDPKVFPTIVAKKAALRRHRQISTGPEMSDQSLKIAGYINDGLSQQAGEISRGGGFGAASAPFTPKAITEDLKVSPEDLKSADSAVEARWQAARLHKQTLADKIRDTSRRSYNAMTRHFKLLDPKTDGAEINILRLHEGASLTSQYLAANAIRGITADLGPKKYGVFERLVILKDLIEYSDRYLQGQDKLPFGYKTAADMQADLQRFSRVAGQHPDILEAVRRRDEFINSMRDELIARDLLPEQVKDYKAYFHHQVLEYMAMDKAVTPGTGAQDVRTHRKGWQKRRVGSEKDFNTSYLEAEFEVVSQAFAQMATQDALARLEAVADISGSLKSAAKERNLETVYGGAENLQRAREIRGEIRSLAESPDAKESYVRQQIAALMEELVQIDPLLPFRNQKFRAKVVMGKLASKGAYDSAPESLQARVQDLRDFYESLKRDKDEEGGGIIEESEILEGEGSFFDLVKWISERPDDSARPALGFWKTIQQEQAFIREKAGKDFLEFTDLVPKGHTLWQPRQGNHFYWAQSLTEKALESFLRGERELTAEDFRKVLAMGGPRRQWVIPERLAQTLDKFTREPDHAIEKFIGAGQAQWKRWTLFNPMRNAIYELNNLSGDADIAFAVDPGIFKYAPEASREMWRFVMKKKAPSPELDYLIKQGVVDAGFSVHELPDLKGDQFFRIISGQKPGMIEKYWDTVLDFNRWREGVLRYAAYKRALERLDKGEQIYWTSKRGEVDTMRRDPNFSNRELAAKLSREAIGDYGNISHAGQWIRSKAIPFYSWMEINAPRYVRLIRNEAASRGIRNRTGAIIGKKALVAGGKVAAQIGAFYILANLWNKTMFPQEEDELGLTPGQLHVILGRREDGAIVTLRLQGAFSDMLDWAGLSNAPQDVQQVMDERAGLSDKLIEAAKAPVNRLAGGSFPIQKAVVEAVLGRKTFPDVFNPTSIRDPYGHVARTFSVGTVYDYLTGKPQRPGTFSPLSLVTYAQNPGEAAYYASRKIVGDWLAEHDMEAPATIANDRANALYYYKQAIKYKDARLAERWKRQYFKLGGSENGLKLSVQKSAPLAPIPHARMSAFVQSLSLKERQIIQAAEAWYKQTY